MATPDHNGYSVQLLSALTQVSTGIRALEFTPNPGRSRDDPEILVKELDEEGEFDPDGAADARDRILASVVRRRGQPEFREHLLSVYNTSLR